MANQAFNDLATRVLKLNQDKNDQIVKATSDLAALTTSDAQALADEKTKEAALQQQLSDLQQQHAAEAADLLAAINDFSNQLFGTPSDVTPPAPAPIPDPTTSDSTPSPSPVSS